MNIKKLASLSVLVAVSVVLTALVHFPIFPAVPFLEYDPADIPVIIAGFAFGPSAGMLITFAAAIIQGLTVSAQSGIYGILMHIIATSFLVVTSSVIYKVNKTKKGAVIALLCGISAMTLSMIPANLYITPYFMGVERSVVKGLLIYIIAFNLIKAGLNSTITFVIYKKISGILHRLDDRKEDHEPGYVDKYQTENRKQAE